jgi:hypothetical protein
MDWISSAIRTTVLSEAGDAMQDWINVSKEHPCPCCGKSDWCTIGSRYIHCMRVESQKPCEGGGWLHLKSTEHHNTPIPPRPPKMNPDELAKIWTPVALKAIRDGKNKLHLLSSQIGVDTRALEMLQVGFVESHGSASYWTFPERDAQTRIVGIAKRLTCPRDGVSKSFCKGGRRGLVYADDWDKYPGPIYIVEGGTDAACALSMRLCVVGRPSNTGGVYMLAQLLRPHRRRRIIIVGERDKKSPTSVQQSNPQHDPRCKGCILCWPGKFGASETTKALAKRLGRAVGTALTPWPFKDIREWFNASELNYNNADECKSLGEQWKRLVR